MLSVTDRSTLLFNILILKSDSLGCSFDMMNLKRDEPLTSYVVVHNNFI